MNKKLKQSVTACERCGKRRRKLTDDSEYCSAVSVRIPSARSGSHCYGGHLWERTLERLR